MLFILAYAQKADLSGSQWDSIISGLAVIVAAAVLVAVPIAIASSRWHTKVRAIAGVAVVWGLVTGGSVMYTVMAQISWSKEYDTLIRTGYYDPRTSGAPVEPLGMWGAMAVIYAGIVGYSLSQKNPPEEIEDEPEQVL